MVDSPSSILLLRLQATGGNTNLWGGYLNTALSTLERASKGYQAYTVNGDATVMWVNYSASNDLEVCNVKLVAGTVAASFTLTGPSYQQDLLIWNATTFAAAIKTGGGAAITIPSGKKARVFCDGANYLFSTPNYTGDTILLTNAGDLVNYTAMTNAIAALLSGTVTGLVLNSAADTTLGYLGQKITGSGAVAISTTGAGGNEKSNIAVGDLALTDGGLQLASFTAAVSTSYAFPVGGVVTLPTPTGSRRKIVLAPYGAGVSTLSGIVNGVSSTTAFILDGDQTAILTDSDATRGWV